MQGSTCGAAWGRRRSPSSSGWLWGQREQRPERRRHVRFKVRGKEVKRVEGNAGVPKSFLLKGGGPSDGQTGRAGQELTLPKYVPGSWISR